jgi:thioredoxin-related protein
LHKKPRNSGEWKQPATRTLLQNTTGQVEHRHTGCPNGLDCFHHYDRALADAKKTGKPLLIDFTGWACVNCRKMEASVWTHPEVDKRLREDVVLVSLYVDDKRELPVEQQTIKKLGNKDFVIKTIGNKWSYFQAERFHINSQPYYVLVDGNEKILSVSEGYNPSPQAYVNFLDAGINLN